MAVKGNRDTAIRTLVLLLGSAEDRDRINAANKLLRSENLDSRYRDQAAAILQSVMNDCAAKDSDRVAAADAFRAFSEDTKAEQTIQQRLANLSDEELDAIIASAALPSLAPAIDPLLL